MTTKELLDTLFTYIEEWRQLEREYHQIPSWRVIKQLRNIKERENLTAVFTARLRHRGVIE